MPSSLGIFIGPQIFEGFMRISHRLPRSCKILAVVCLALSACTWTNAVDHYIQGQLAIDRGDNSAAMKNLSAAIEQNPQMGAAWLARGMLMKRQGDYQSAAADLEHAAKLQPLDFDANFQLGAVYQVLKRFREAVAAYQKAVQVRPLNPEVNKNLAVTYNQLGEPLRALPYAKRAVEGDPDSPLTQANLGMLYAQFPEHSDDAITSLRRSIELNSKQPEVYLALGNQYLAVGLENIRNGKTDAGRGSFELAKNILDAAATRLPKDPLAPAIHERLALAWYKLDDLDKATDEYSKSLDLEKDYTPAINGLGAMHMARALKSTPPDADQGRQALAFWHRSLKLNPDQPKIQKLVDTYKSLE